MLKKIKALFVAYKQYKKVKGGFMKAGIKSTEFWMTVFTAVVSIYCAVQGMIDPALTAKVLAGISAVYTICRTIIKLTPSTKDDQILARIESILKDKELLN